MKMSPKGDSVRKRALQASIVTALTLALATACSSQNGAASSSQSESLTPATAQSAEQSDGALPTDGPPVATTPTVPVSDGPAGEDATNGASTAAAGSIDTGATADTGTVAPSTIGPAPSSGDIDETVPAREVSTLPPVPLDQPANFGNNVTVKIDKVDAVNAQARVPGELSGPAVVLGISITNGASAAIGLDSVAVSATMAGEEPAVEVTTEPSRPFSGSLDAGQTASADYVFLIPPNQRDGVRISVQYASDPGIATFTGSV